ncbi:ABC transporter permease subunit [Klebsiella variicola subsp. variicola]|nr:ABC transporter permease subunit [Klebsiella variicola subsp. variicola]
MMLTLYQTLRVVPNELVEAADAFRYNPWQKFWRLGFIYSFPGLLWNTMVSQSAAWFALIASEMLTVGNGSTNLPGVGSYIGIALQDGSVPGVIRGVLALIVNIVIFDQLLFRPLVRYAHQFKYEDVSDRKVPSSWFSHCLSHSMIGHGLEHVCKQFSRFWLFVLPKIWYGLRLHRVFAILGQMNWLWSSLWYLAIVVGCIYYGHQLWLFIPKEYLTSLPGWMGLTAGRVIAAMVLSVIIFTPLGVWIGLRPGLVRFFQPIIQVFAAVPANVFYPLIAFMIVAWHQNLGSWTIPMIMLGTQWYVLFNVIAGTSMIPSQMVEASKIFHLRGWLWWTKFTLPAVFPYIVTGVISAAGAWNTAIAAEVLNWGKNYPTNVWSGRLYLYRQRCRAKSAGSIRMSGDVLDGAAVHYFRLATPVSLCRKSFQIRLTIKSSLSGHNMKNSNLVLEVKNVSKFYKKDRKQKSRCWSTSILEVKENEIVALLGRSGSGKSTLLRMAAGLVEPDLGTIVCCDLPVNGPGKNTSMVFQSFALFPWLNVFDSVAFGLQAQGLSSDEVDKRTMDMLDLIGLTGYEKPTRVSFQEGCASASGLLVHWQLSRIFYSWMNHSLRWIFSLAISFARI